MQKKLTAMTLALFLMFSVTAHALEVEPRWNSTTRCIPTLEFSGTKASCSILVNTVKGATIDATMTLYHGTDEVASWDLSGTTRLSETKTCTVTKGETYKLTIVVNVEGPNGSDSITKSTSKTC